MPTDRCAVPRCRRPVEITWLGRPLCDAHWTAHAEGKVDLRKKLGISREGEKRPVASTK